MPGYNRLNLPEPYRALLDLDAAGFAWEWLRRNPDFRALWRRSGVFARRASDRALAAARRGGFAMLGRHPLAADTSPWGYPFAAHPDTPATARPPLGWMPDLRVTIISLVRPLPWARALPGLRFTPDRWGAALALKAPGGTHILVRRHGSPEIALWLPERLAPRTGEPFGLYLHPDAHAADRLRAAATLRRALGTGPPLRYVAYRDAHRRAAMLCIHDLVAAGLPLRDIAARLLPAWPDDWRSSSERSDLRRLADAAPAMVAGGYRALLAPRRPGS